MEIECELTMSEAKAVNIHIAPGDTRPIFKQIVDGIRMEIACGNLPIGCKLPSVRGLAMQLTINANTVAKAYNELTSQGLLEAKIAQVAAAAAAAEKVEKSDVLTEDKPKGLEVVFDPETEAREKAAHAAALAAAEGCGETEVCYSYISGEIGLQTEWFDHPGMPTLCDTAIFNVRVKNVKQLTPIEQTKQQELTTFLNSRSFIKSVLVTDGKHTKEIKLIEDGKLVETFNQSD